MSNLNWHEQLFNSSYRIFGVEPPMRAEPVSYWATVGFAGLYLVFAGIFYVLLNIGSLPLGVYCEPIWKPRARFVRLRFPFGMPAIAVMGTIYGIIVIIHAWQRFGLWHALGPLVVEAGLLIAAFGGLMVLNHMRRQASRMTGTKMTAADESDAQHANP